MTQKARFVVLALAGFFVALSARGQNITVQIGSSAPPPTSLVDHTNVWRWHKGTNAPTVSWQTITDASLDATWGSGPGGFGYNTDNTTPAETNQCRTVLFDMSGTSATNYSTFYIRKTFTIGAGVDTNAHIQLTVDWDDAFMAWFDGVYITNRLVANAPTEPAFTAVSTNGTTHESSNGASGSRQPAETYDLGAVGTRTGTHVLAIVGLNANKSTSSDFILVADLALVASGGGSVVNGNLFSVVSGNTVVLSGTNSVAGSSRVSVNGDDALFTPGTGAWVKTNSLAPGLNRFFITALQPDGSLLGSTNATVVAEASFTSVSGTLAGSNYWSSALGNIHVTSTVTIPAAASLTIAPGTVVLLGANAGLTVNGTLTATGTSTAPIFFGPVNGTTEWGTISAAASGASVQMRFFESIAGKVSVASGASLLIEDARMSRTYAGSMMAGNGGSFTIRRSHLHHFHDSNINGGSVLAEDMLVEDCDSTDGDPFEMSNATGAMIRRFTLRRSTGFNADAFDCNSVNNVTFENLLVHDISDKGISIGTAGGPGSVGVVVRNCLIYDTRTGIALKDDSRAVITNVTIADSLYGIQFYPKYTTNTINAGGRCTNYFNNILWNNTTQFTVTNGAFVPSFSDLTGTNWPGTNNISTDPLFVNPAAGDYHLQIGSPCIGTGQAGANMGVIFPVGGLPGTPPTLAAVLTGSGSIRVAWQDDADNETGFAVERSLDAASWSNIGNTGANVTNFTDNTVAAGSKYYYRVYATNSSGSSDYSSIASGRIPLVVAGGNVGGTITSDTCWADNGVFTVTSSVTVPAGVTLYIKPGAQVRFGSTMTMTVNGQLIAVGASSNHIHFTKSGANNWGSLDILNAPLESRIEFADFDSCAGTSIGGHASEVHVNGGSKVFFNFLNFANVPAQEYISFDGSTFIVQNSGFPTYPWATSAPEMLHGVNGINAGGYGIFRSNYFGHTFGFNDTIDFTGGQRPGPILQFIGNVFDGAGDDNLDLDSADAWIEGNIFMHVHRDPNRNDEADDTGSAISGGVDFAGQFSEWTVINNLFYDVDHVFLNKGGGNPGGGRVVFMNNTVVHVNQESGAGPSTNIAAFIFTDDQVAFPNATYGAGAYVANNIFWDCPMLATNYNLANHTIIFENNIVPGAWGGAGSNNVVIDPLLNLQLITTITNASAAQVRAAFTPKTNSPALGTGFGFKYDKGGLNPLGMMIVGEPTNSASSNATLTVGPIEAWRYGSAVPVFNGGYPFYKWKLDNGAWSAELSTTNFPTIALSNLSNGPHTVYVVGRNDAGIGYYQDDPFVYPTDIGLIAAHVTASRTWVVGSGSLDTDGDGMPDDYEDAHGLNKLVNDADGDLDGDGMTNLQEYLAGTDPQSPSSRLWLNALTTVGNNFSFQFLAVSNKTYTVQHRPALGTGSWLRLLDVTAAATNRTIVVTTNLTGSTHFYQVVTPLAP